MKHQWIIQVETWPLIGQPGTQRNLFITVDASIDLMLDGTDATELARTALINTDYVCREAVFTKAS